MNGIFLVRDGFLYHFAGSGKYGYFYLAFANQEDIDDFTRRNGEKDTGWLRGAEDDRLAAKRQA